MTKYCYSFGGGASFRGGLSEDLETGEMENVGCEGGASGSGDDVLSWNCYWEC